jgi:CRP-like cAMP-binding protein
LLLKYKLREKRNHFFCSTCGWYSSGSSSQEEDEVTSVPPLQTIIFEQRTKIFTALNIDPLLAFFDSYVPLSTEEKADLISRVTERKLKRKEFFLQGEQVCRHHGFVVKGCFRTYGVDKAGKEHNLQFAAENDWIVDIVSFYADKPSRLFIEAMESSHILLIEKKELLYFYEYYPKFVRYFKVIFENKFVEMQNRVLQNISSTAEERYLAFLDQYPQLSNRIPGVQIASYLGVTPEFLSKVRRDVAGK